MNTDVTTDGVLIPISRGLHAIVDADRADDLNRSRWFAIVRPHTTHAARHAYRPDCARTSQLMHTYLMGRGTQVEHINGDGLDNRMANLRPVTSAEKRQRQPKKAGTSSRFKGVCWRGEYQSWQAGIKVSGRSLHLGCYRDEIDAAIAYDAAARIHFGEFAALNFAQTVEHPALCARGDA